MPPITLIAAVLPRVTRLPDPQADPQRARELIREILSRPEFQRPPPSVFERIQRWLSENLARLLGNLFQNGAGSAATWLVVALIVFGLVVLVRRLLRTVQPDPGVVVDITTTARRPASDWRAEAEAWEADGNWKEALRCRFRALVAELVERGRLGDVPGRTAGEYRVELRTSTPEAGDAFSEAADLFERAWYGDEPTGAAENQRFRAAAERVHEVTV